MLKGRENTYQAIYFLATYITKGKPQNLRPGEQESLRGIQDFFTPHQGGGIFYSSSEGEHDFFQPMVKGWGAGFF